VSLPAASATTRQMGEVYDASARVYASHWAPVLHTHARDLVGMLPVSGGRVVVDVAAGAGTLLPLLAPLAHPDDLGRPGILVALDYSASMLALADPAVPRVRADAHRLPLTSGRCSVAVAAFVLFMLDDAHTAVAELARVLEPGGWLATATWGAETGSEADRVIADELDRIGAPAWPDPPRSDELTNSPAAMRSLLADAGFVDVRTESRPLGARFEPEDALTLRTGFGALAWRYRLLDEAAQDEVRDRARRRLDALPPAALCDDSEVLLTVARRSWH
jgi:ubiquinone/menaquinone biosynthesis C-methylase UbiE